MPTKMIDTFKEIVKTLPKRPDIIKISEEDGYKIYQEINEEMKEYRRELSKKEKESRHAAAEILLT